MHGSLNAHVPSRVAPDGRVASAAEAAATAVQSVQATEGPRLAPSLLRFMGSTELFDGLRQSELLGLSPAIEQVRVPRGETIESMQQGSPRVYVVVRGAVRVCVACDGHEQRTVAIVGSHAVLSDAFSIMAGNRWTQTFSAYETSLLLSIRHADLIRVANHDGRVAMNLATLLERRVLWLQRLTFMMACASPQRRVAACLIDLSEQHGHPTLDGGTVINLRVLQRDIADLVGVSRQVVSSTITSMRRAGVLEVSRQRIVVRDERALWLLAAPEQPFQPETT